MRKWMTAFLLAGSIFGSLALTAAVPVLAQRAGAKAAACKTHFDRGGAPTEGHWSTTTDRPIGRYRC
jgi:hypothetical protein